MSFNITRPSFSAVPVKTAEGGQGFARDPRMELYSVLATSLLSGDSFYETVNDRVIRIKSLIAQIAKMPKGNKFLAGLAVYVRDHLYLRSSPTVLSAEMFANKVEGAEQVASEVWKRGDEHLEALAYLKIQGITRPKQMLKAIAKRLNRFNAYTAVKYACGNKNFTQRDALRLAHPVPKTPAQSALFKFISQGWDKLNDNEKALLPEITKLKQGESFTWEQQISTKGSTKETWEEIIPKMGYMALLRNLRNFMEKGVSKKTIDFVAEKLANKDEVLRSKQLPFRFLSAYNAITPMSESHAKNIFGKALRAAVDYSANNVPDLEGSTLILVDISGSMSTPISSKQKTPDPNPITLAMVGALLGSIVSTKIQGDVVAFATRSVKVEFAPGEDILSRVKKVLSQNVDHGTLIADALNKHLKTQNNKVYNRVIIFTDMQAQDDVWNTVKAYKAKNPDFATYVVDLTGYVASCLPKGNKCYQLAGFSERLFSWISEEEASSSSIIDKLTTLGEKVMTGTYTNKVPLKVVEEEDTEE
jgi:hypothetical protein